MKQGIIETLVGFFVIIIAIAFFVFAYNLSNLSKVSNGYSILAKFQNIDGISEGSDVKLAGIKVGHVESLTLEHDTYYAEVNLFIENGIEVPVDSRAIVSTNGLLGGKYIRISPGGAENNLGNGGKIKFTQSALNIEDLIGKLMYSITSK